jgi:LacI family transcriptional regulator
VIVDRRMPWFLPRESRNISMPQPDRSTPTLQLVADVAGVHRSTASRALNPETAHRLNPELVGRIRRVAGDLGYRRDAAAAALRTGRTQLIGVLVPDIANPVFGPILNGIETELAAKGFSLIIANAGDEAERQIEIIEHLLARRVEGIILATARENDPTLDRCLALGTPVVLVNRAAASARVSAVVTDDHKGMGYAVAHLAALGHRKIAHLAGPQDLSTGRLRQEGFCAAMRRAGLNPSAIVVATAYSRDAGREAARELLEYRGVTAIAAANDLLALGCYQALSERGLSCPGDLSIVGHNDMPLVDMANPPLTTVRIRPVEMGRRAAELLLQQLGAAKYAPQLEMTEPELVIRSSTAPPKISVEHMHDDDSQDKDSQDKDSRDKHSQDKHSRDKHSQDKHSQDKHSHDIRATAFLGDI